MAKALILDPALVGTEGHHWPSSVGFAAAAHENGFETSIVANLGCSFSEADGFPVAPLFEGPFYQVTNGNGPPLSTRLRQRQAKFRDDLGRGLGTIGGNDLLLLAFATPLTMNGLAAWASGLPEERRPRLVVWLQRSPEQDEFAQALKAPFLVANAIDRLRSLFGDKVSFCASTEGIAAACRASGTGSFPILPFTALRPPLAPPADREVPAAPTLVIVGDLNTFKGSALIAPVVRSLVARLPHVRWFIGGSASYAPEIDRRAIEKLARDFDTVVVDLRPGGLDNYDTILRAADLVVLPYSPEHYRSCGSAVAEEAALLGIPFVSPVGIVEQLGDLPGASIFTEWTALDIAKVVEQAVAALPALTAEARRAGAQRRKQLRDFRVENLPAIFPPPQHVPAAIDTGHTLPAVDIIVTLHNYRRFIRDCLASVARQTYPNWRCTVVDDASTDLAVDEARQLVASFGPRFNYERHAVAQGRSARSPRVCRSGRARSSRCSMPMTCCMRTHSITISPGI